MSAGRARPCAVSSPAPRLPGRLRRPRGREPHARNPPQGADALPITPKRGVVVVVLKVKGPRAAAPTTATVLYSVRKKGPRTAFGGGGAAWTRAGAGNGGAPYGIPALDTPDTFRPPRATIHNRKHVTSTTVRQGSGKVPVPAPPARLQRRQRSIDGLEETRSEKRLLLTNVR